MPDSPSGKLAPPALVDLEARSVKSESPEIETSCHDTPPENVEISMSSVLGPPTSLIPITSEVAADAHLVVSTHHQGLPHHQTSRSRQGSPRRESSAQRQGSPQLESAPQRKASLRNEGIPQHKNINKDDRQQILMARGSYLSPTRLSTSGKVSDGVNEISRGSNPGTPSKIDPRHSDVVDPIETDSDGFHERQRMHNAKARRLSKTPASRRSTSSNVQRTSLPGRQFKDVEIPANRAPGRHRGEIWPSPAEPTSIVEAQTNGGRRGNLPRLEREVQSRIDRPKLDGAVLQAVEIPRPNTDKSLGHKAKQDTSQKAEAVLSNGISDSTRGHENKVVLPITNHTANIQPDDVLADHSGSSDRSDEDDARATQKSSEAIPRAAPTASGLEKTSHFGEHVPQQANEHAEHDDLQRRPMQTASIDCILDNNTKRLNIQPSSQDGDTETPANTRFTARDRAEREDLLARQATQMNTANDGAQQLELERLGHIATMNGFHVTPMSTQTQGASRSTNSQKSTKYRPRTEEQKRRRRERGEPPRTEAQKARRKELDRQRKLRRDEDGMSVTTSRSWSAAGSQLTEKPKHLSQSLIPSSFPGSDPNSSPLIGKTLDRRSRSAIREPGPCSSLQRSVSLETLGTKSHNRNSQGQTPHSEPRPSFPGTKADEIVSGRQDASTSRDLSGKSADGLWMSGSMENHEPKKTRQTKLNITVNKKLKGRALDRTSPTQPEAPPVEVLSDQDGNESVSSFFSEDERNGICKAGPSIKKKSNPRSKTQDSQKTNLSIDPMIDPMLAAQSAEKPNNNLGTWEVSSRSHNARRSKPKFNSRVAAGKARTSLSSNGTSLSSRQSAMSEVSAMTSNLSAHEAAKTSSGAAQTNGKASGSASQIDLPPISYPRKLQSSANLILKSAEDSSKTGSSENSATHSFQDHGAFRSGAELDRAASNQLQQEFQSSQSIPLRHQINSQVDGRKEGDDANMVEATTTRRAPRFKKLSEMKRPSSHASSIVLPTPQSTTHSHPDPLQTSDTGDATSDSSESLIGVEPGSRFAKQLTRRMSSLLPLVGGNVCQSSQHRSGLHRSNIFPALR